MAFAKTTQPNAAGAFTRRRLHRLLNRQGHRSITWVWGPPGAGKTTLISSFLASRTLRTLWYRVDAGDADVATFFYYLAQTAPRRPRPLPLLTADYRPGLELFARRFLRELFLRMKPRFALVLDDYQEASCDALLHDVVRLAAEELPAGGRIIISSRSGPPPALARLQLNQAFDLIEWPQLRLTATEAGEFARRHTRARLPTAEVRRLHELTDGWIAGLVLLLQRRAEERSSAAWQGRPEVLFNYFAAEIFNKAAPRTQDVLLQTAFLPNVTAAMAAELTGDAGAAKILAALHQANYFTDKRYGAEETYQYHPLFREFLLAQARHTFSPERMCEIRSTAARLLEAAGEVEAAAELLRDAGNWDALADFIRRHAPSLLDQGRVETVERWLAWVPDATLDSTPWLLCWRGVCQLGRGHEACRADCERAIGAFRARRDVDGALLAWSALVTSHLMEGWLEPLDSLIPLLEQLQAESPRPASEPILARVATTMLIAIAFRQPGHPDGVQWADQALERTRRQPDLILRGIAAFGWFLYHWNAGHTSKASVVVEEMRALSQRRDIPSVVALHAALPVVYHEMFHALPSYRQTVDDIRQHAHATGLRHVVSTSVLVAGAFTAIGRGDFDLAHAWIDELATESPRFGPMYTFAYDAVLAADALARGDFERAKAHVDELARRGYSTGYPVEDALSHTMAAYVSCRAGEHDAAWRHVQRALEVASAVRSPYLEWIGRLAEAHVALEGGREDEALCALRRAMTLGRTGGYVSSHVWVPATMARLCARALDAGIEVDYVRDLVTRRRLVCDPPPVEIEAWPWPVKIVALGRFAIVKNNRAVRSAGKAPRKPLAVLKILVGHGPDGVSEAFLMDTLWPDAEGDAARHALTTSVFRLRRLLGHDSAVVRGDGRISLDPACCWVDAWALDRLLDRAEAAAANGRPGDATRWTERAAALYAGPLIGIDSEAALPASWGDQLRRRLLRQLLAAGRHCEGANEWQRAVGIFEAALKVDPEAREVNASLMVALQRLGRAADVDAVFRRPRDRQDGPDASPATPDRPAALRAR